MKWILFSHPAKCCEQTSLKSSHKFVRISCKIKRTETTAPDTVYASIASILVVSTPSPERIKGIWTPATGIWTKGFPLLEKYWALN